MERKDRNKHVREMEEAWIREGSETNERRKRTERRKKERKKKKAREEEARSGARIISTSNARKL